MIFLVDSEAQSVNVTVYSLNSPKKIIQVGIDQLSDNHSVLNFGDELLNVAATDHRSAVKQIFGLLFARSFDLNEIYAVVHRIPRLDKNLILPALITDDFETQLSSIVNTSSDNSAVFLETIRQARTELPDCLHIAILNSLNDSDLNYQLLASEVRTLCEAADTIPAIKIGSL